MDILISETKKDTYFGDFIYNYYSVFIDIFNKCSLVDKLLLIIIRLINLFAIFGLFFGFFLPKNLVIWHIVLCFIVLSMVISSDSHNGDFDFTIFTNATYTILKRNNNVGYSNEQLLLASKLVPIHHKSFTTVVLILMLISIFGYIYPKYSVNTCTSKLLQKLNIINGLEEDNNNYNIDPQFKLNMNNNEVVIDNMIKENKLQDVSEQKNNIELLNNNNLVPTSTEINKNNEYDLNLNKVDSNLSIFDKKIQQITIKPSQTNNDVVLNKVSVGGAGDDQLSKKEIFIKSGMEDIKIGGNNLSNPNPNPNPKRLFEIERIETEKPLIGRNKVKMMAPLSGNGAKGIYMDNNLNLNLNYGKKDINKEVLYNSLKKFNDIV